MLIVFAVVPVSAPTETVLGKQFITQIIFIDFIGKGLAAVGVALCAGR